MRRRIITKEILIDARPEKVFDALTTPEKIIIFFPVSEVISNWEVGGVVEFKGGTNDQSFTNYGVITEFTKPHHFTYQYWINNYGEEKTPENHIYISYSLTRKDNLTKLQVVQRNIRSQELFETMDNVVWGNILNSLKNYVELDT